MFSMLLAGTIAAASHPSSAGTQAPASLSATQAAGSAGNSVSTVPQAAAPLSVRQAAGPSGIGQVAALSTAAQTSKPGPSQLSGKAQVALTVRQPQQEPAAAQATPMSAPQAARTAPQTAAQTAPQTAAQTAAPATPPAPTYPYTGNPQADLVTIARYLVNDGGYSPAGAAGVAGCIQGESGGSPEATQGYAAGGAGLIQWTPEASISQYGGTYGGNPQTDFSNQLGAIIRYNAANGNVAALNANTDPVAAADYYSQNFERPAVLDSDVRAGTAIAVYNALTGR